MNLHLLGQSLVRLTIAALSLVMTGNSVACWTEAGERYGVNPHVLHAIAKCESSLNPLAMNRSHMERTGSYDIGLMQINSTNLKALKSYGIGEPELMDACTNIHVGAWILADKIRRHGNNWEAVGAYNAACTQLKGEACSAARYKYASCVYRNLPPELKDGAGSSVDASTPRAEQAWQSRRTESGVHGLHLRVSLSSDAEAATEPTALAPQLMDAGGGQ